MSAPSRARTRLQPEAAQPDRRARRCRLDIRSSRAGFRRSCALLVGVLLALWAPLSGPQGQAHAQGPAQGIGRDESSVPVVSGWVVLELRGIAAWRAQGELRWRAFELGEVLPPGCEIETGPDGHIVLAAGGDQLIVAPRGRVLLPEAAPGQDRRLRHERGRIRVHIEAREGRDVRIETPLLSLGIKGTTFDVEVDPEHNSVTVYDGEVQVTPPGRQDPVELGAGEGLRQPAGPGAPATRFSLPQTRTAPGPADRADWLLSPVDSGVGRGASTAPAEAEGVETSPQSAAGQRRNERAQASSPRGQERLSSFDELAASWKTLVIAAAALLILGIPTLGLLYNLREQWRGRARAKGRRRRELVRG